MGLLERIREEGRQRRTGDTEFLSQLLYFFELRVPAEVVDGQAGSFFYPLILPPESYRLSEPFTVNQTFTNGGGIFVEEQGIITREITLSGTTGWKPRALPRDKSTGVTTQVRKGANASYSRALSLSRTGVLVEKMSGQRHFQFLQDSVFRTYADLKRDPATSKDTELYFHIAKDNESWRVHPLSFDLERSTGRNLLYPYNIRLLATAPAAEAPLGVSEDKEVLDRVGNPIPMLRKGAGDIRAAVLDLTNVQNQVRLTVLQGNSVISDATTIAAAVEDFLNGTGTFINVPYNYVNNTKQLLDTSLTTFQRGVDLGLADVPNTVLNSLRRIGDSLAAIASYPEKFRTSIDDAVARFNQIQELVTNYSQQALLSAEEAGAPATIRGYSPTQIGTSLLAGDRTRASNELGLGRNVPKYTSATERVIEQGDTLPNLAARYLGDARKWKFLAIFNDLEPPYISEQGLTATVKVGDTILIPNFETPSRERDTAVTLAVLPEQPGPEHLLGIDLRVDEVGSRARGTYDLVVDVENGSTDFKYVRGVPNLQQGIRSRLITDKGSDILYTRIGLSRVVGLGFTAVDLENAQIRVVEAVRGDPRIAAVRSLTFLEDSDAQADLLDVTLEAEVRGFNQPVNIQTTLR